MECIKCGSKSGLEMYPIRWEGDGDAVGFVFVCAACDKNDLGIRWSFDDGREEGSDQETD